MTTLAARKIITGYGGRGFKINADFVEGSLLIWEEQCWRWDGAVTEVSLAPLLENENIELLLIGTGKVAQPISDSIKNLLRSRAIAFDVMDTGAACRTFNVLAGEGRRVAAAIVAV